MDDLERFEPELHTFSGTVRMWATSTAEVITDSGLVLFLDTRGQPPMPVGSRVEDRHAEVPALSFRHESDAAVRRAV